MPSFTLATVALTAAIAPLTTTKATSLAVRLDVRPRSAKEQKAHSRCVAAFQRGQSRPSWVPPQPAKGAAITTVPKDSTLSVRTPVPLTVGDDAPADAK